MAEPKKDAKKEVKKEGPTNEGLKNEIFGLNIFGFLIAAIIVFIIGTAVLASLSSFFGGIYRSFDIDVERVTQYSSSLITYTKILSVLASVYLGYLILSLGKQIQETKKKLDAMFAPPPLNPIVASNAAVAETRAQKLWRKVQEHIQSENPNDWKIAIIEADTILDELVEKMGYPGVTLGERLKNIELSDFTSIQDAWEAHKVRNAIAHEPAYQITEREARRIISLFEKVFKEFDFIN
jgi:hypothetical protein